MRATIMHAAGDVRIEDVADPTIIEPTDALVRVTSACICGSDLWPYADMEPSETGQSMGHEAIGVVADIGADVSTVKRGDLVVMPFASSDGTLFTLPVGGGPAPVRAYIDELLPDILDGRIEPGRVFDRTVGLDGVPDGYRAMADRRCIKVLVKP